MGIPLGGQVVGDERKAFEGVCDDDLPTSEIHVIGDSICTSEPRLWVHQPVSLPMKILVQVCMLLVGLGLLNVWLLRFKKATAYRGATATNMLEEFAVYGLPAWSCYAVGFLKIVSALALIAGFAYPALVLPAAAIIAVLMAGAVAMHAKVHDPLKKTLPALSVLIASVVIIIVHWPA